MYKVGEVPKGVAIGLAYTGYGGSILFLEARKASFANKNSVAKLKVTGSLGDVMKESMQISYTYARSYLESIDNSYLEENEVHIHAPEGATPKDGPSAGVCIVSALVSLATGKPMKANVGMTGELSLRGNVLKIGGVKEKVLAGKREGLTDLIFPAQNADDVEDLKDYIKEGIQFHMAKDYKDVAKVLFPH